ncbi:sensor histidine kinase [Clostridium polyendosporum]|uniref:histidine kinase n=1 Tax=Clostridium polyendosporum TaxID=69208 RepID=A0A919RX18_9CLOT|nr:ATP-binding protein [Clostridium polyendosporum]GIM28047.1 sensor histidine kinase [Clostridium polyendosporum]
MKKLRQKLIYSYIFVTALSIIIISILANLYLEKGFNEYVSDKINERKNFVITSIESQYKNNQWDVNAITNIGINALQDGLIIKVTDTNGNVVWDAREYNHGMCEAMIRKISNNMMSKFPNFNGQYVINEYDLSSDGVKNGILEVGYYGPFYYNDADFVFVNTLNKIFVAAGVIGLLSSIILGIIISGSISNPILRVVKATNLISTGHYKDRIIEKSKVEEITSLVTSVNNLAESLEKQELLRTRLTRDIAHELRTPLTTLQSHLEAILDGIWEPTSDRLTSFHEEILRLKRLVGDLERLSRYDQETMKLDKEKINVKELVNQIIINFEKQFIDKKVQLISDIKECIINVDKDKINQAIINILSNALKYTPEGGEVIVKCYYEDGKGVISIEDSGIGISKEHLSHIFERFYRVDESRTRNTGGAGIGLAITKAIVSAHGGGITVESNINEGTIFRIYLPS